MRPGAAFAWGHGGQRVYVDFERELVFVFTAEPDATDEGAALEIERFLPFADALAATAT